MVQTKDRYNVQIINREFPAVYINAYQYDILSCLILLYISELELFILEG